MSGTRRIRGATADACYVQALVAAERALKTHDRATLVRQAAVLRQTAGITDVTLRRSLRTRVNRVLKAAGGTGPVQPRAKETEAVTIKRVALPNPAKEYRWFVVSGEGTTHRTHPDRPRQAICGQALDQVMWEGARGPSKPKWCSGCQREISRMKQTIRLKPASAVLSSKPQSLVSARATLQRRNEQNRAALEADLAGQQDSRSVRAIPVNFEGNKRRH